VKWVAGGYVSKYFYDGFMNLWNAGMRDDFETLVADFPGYNIWMAYSFRVTHWRDIVPHVPPELFELYYHHKSEVRTAVTQNMVKGCGL
ncbi:hypothetical protein TELCIR_20348, partial [Teladorsagia circumcincta]